MKLPEFKPKRVFLNDIDVPCLYAKVKNSKLPGIASRHVAESKQDPICEIYLLGKKPEMSGWHREILGQLLEEKGLPAAVEQAMREYETDPKWAGEGYIHLAPEDQQRIRRHGIVPYVTVSTIVLDDIRREVLICAGNALDGNLEEHGICIHLRKGRWRFGYGDYFSRYLQRYEKERPRKSLSLGDEAWERLFPKAPPGTEVVTEAGFLYGTWALDERASKKMLNRMGRTIEQIDSCLTFQSFSSYRFSATTFEYSQLDVPLLSAKFVGCERIGNRVTIRYCAAENDESRMECWFDGKVLVEKSGLVYRHDKLK